MLMENISIQIVRIFIFLCATELQNIQLISVPEPCPDIVHSTTIADMCTSDFANERPSNGGVTIDSVALRVMTQHDGCTCEVSLQNQNTIYTIYMRKYDLLTMAAPEQEACGLAIDVNYTSPETFPRNNAAIECTNGIQTRSVSLTQNGVLYLRSRIIGGSFSRGYCIQIYRQHKTDDIVGIHINCSHPNVQKTPEDKTDSSNMQTTQQMTNAAIHDSTISENGNENGNVRIPVIIAAVLGWCLTALFAITTLCLYRRLRKQQPNNSGEQNINSPYDDLHVTRLSSCYSSLNASAVNSEQYEHI